MPWDLRECKVGKKKEPYLEMTLELRRHVKNILILNQDVINDFNSKSKC
jgi:hypothetical protein